MPAFEGVKLIVQQNRLCEVVHCKAFHTPVNQSNSLYALLAEKELAGIITRGNYVSQ